MAGCFRRGTSVLTTQPWVAKAKLSPRGTPSRGAASSVRRGEVWQHREVGLLQVGCLRLRCHHCARRLAASNAAVAAAAVAAAAIVPDLASERVPAQHRLWMRRQSWVVVVHQVEVLH